MGPDPTASALGRDLKFSSWAFGEENSLTGVLRGAGLGLEPSAGHPWAGGDLGKWADVGAPGLSHRKLPCLRQRSEAEPNVGGTE